jgi:hypothetical protein
MGKLRYSSTILDLSNRWSGQLHVVAALPQGKSHRYPIYKEAGCAPEPVWTLWRWERIPTPDGKRSPADQPVARPYTDWATPAYNIKIEITEIVQKIVDMINLAGSSKHL